MPRRRAGAAGPASRDRVNAPLRRARAASARPASRLEDAQDAPSTVFTLDTSCSATSRFRPAAATTARSPLAAGIDDRGPSPHAARTTRLAEPRCSRTASSRRRTTPNGSTPPPPRRLQTRSPRRARPPPRAPASSEPRERGREQASQRAAASLSASCRAGRRNHDDSSGSRSSSSGRPRARPPAPPRSSSSPTGCRPRARQTRHARASCPAAARSPAAGSASTRSTAAAGRWARIATSSIAAPPKASSIVASFPRFRFPGRTVEGSAEAPAGLRRAAEVWRHVDHGRVLRLAHGEPTSPPSSQARGRGRCTPPRCCGSPDGARGVDHLLAGCHRLRSRAEPRSRSSRTSASPASARLRAARRGRGDERRRSRSGASVEAPESLYDEASVRRTRQHGACGSAFQRDRRTPRSPLERSSSIELGVLCRERRDASSPAPRPRALDRRDPSIEQTSLLYAGGSLVPRRPSDTVRPSNRWSRTRSCDEHGRRVAQICT